MSARWKRLLPQADERVDRVSELHAKEVRSRDGGIGTAGRHRRSSAATARNPTTDGVQACDRLCQRGVLTRLRLSCADETAHTLEPQR